MNLVVRALVVLAVLTSLVPALPVAAQSDVARIQREIYAVLPFDRDRFSLAGGERSAFALYGDPPSALVPLDCQRAVTFTIISGANDLGAIGVGICDEHAARLRTLAPRARQGLDGVVASLKRSGAQWREDEARRAGIFYQLTSSGGGDLHYFAVLLIGHGVLVTPTVVLLRADRAIVVQAATTHLCDPDRAPVKLCTDVQGNLSEIARRVLAAFP